MSGNLVIHDIFNDFQNHLDSDQDVREVIRNICKETDRLSREITTTLQIIHHDEDAIEEACLKARQMFGKAHEGYQKLKNAVPKAEYFKFYDHWRNMTQRYCFLISLTVWLESGLLARHETVAEVLGGVEDWNQPGTSGQAPLFPPLNLGLMDSGAPEASNPATVANAPLPSDTVGTTDEKEGFHVDLEDYLVGLLILCTELGRLAVNSASRGEYSRTMQISKFVSEVNAGFRLLNLKNDNLRKRYDALKYDVKKIEEVVYDLSLRGLLNNLATTAMANYKRNDPPVHAPRPNTHQ